MLIAYEPSPALWLMPTESLARSFSKSRWLPMLEDSPVMLECYPAEADKITYLEQNFTRSTLTFVGSNSPANLASRPVRVLIADEVDKFAEATSKEADALELAEQRLKSFSSSKAFMTSTPTVVEGRLETGCDHQHSEQQQAVHRWDREMAIPGGSYALPAVRITGRT